MRSAQFNDRFTSLVQAQSAQQTTASSFNPPPVQGNARGLTERRQVTDPVESSRGRTTATQKEEEEEEEEEEIQEPFDSKSRRWVKGWPVSKYHHVRVLLVQWEDENLGVDEEVRNLEAIFSSNYPKGYNFHTQRYSIPNDAPEDQLTLRLLDFRKGATDKDLLILYYAGHAGGSAQECVWSGKDDYDSPWLNWHNIQNLILGSPADVLLILDCCFATLAARNNGMGDNWMLGASNKETKATGVARNSFSSTLARELDRCAYRYWSKKETLSVQSLDHAFVVWERDLDFTPKLTRLTDHECPATDLTPLLHPCQQPRMQTTRTEPTPQPRLQNSSPPLPARPKSSSTRILRGPQATWNHTEPSSSTSFSSDVLVKRAKIELQNLRILNLPTSTDDIDIMRWFKDRSIEHSSIHKIGPKIVSGSTFLGTIITFADADIAKRAMRIANLEFHPRLDKWHQQTGQQIAIDDKFGGLTCIYASTKGPDREPTADVVIVHGAGGHPINSFSIHIAEPLSEASWARDSLPKELEDVRIFPRIMTYGWNASAWYDPQREIEDLARAIKDVRANTPTRPLILIGHGIGGLLIKQLVIDTINFGFSERNFQNPIQACFFLALPERLDHFDSRANGFSKIFEEFDTIRKEWSIKCAFFKEAHSDAKYPNGSHRNAGLAEPSFELDADYVGVAKLPEKENSLSLVLNVMRKALTKEPTQPFKPRPPNTERVYAKLKGYDTRFLVDDSDSMAGARWTTAKQVMARIASIAVMYDKNGVDVRFFNAYPEDEERLNLDSAEKVMSLFENLYPEGSTPTADTLEIELNEYVHEYKANRRIKGLNLIVITDGAPSPRQDVEGVIVKYARILALQDAPPLQVGIQFVQIGDDKGAKDLLDRLDNDLQEKHELDRDVSWLILLNMGTLMNITDGGHRTLG